MNDTAGYLGVDRKWAQGWGQGLALALLTAVHEKTAGDPGNEAALQPNSVEEEHV